MGRRVAWAAGLRAVSGDPVVEANSVVAWGTDWQALATCAAVRAAGGWVVH